MYKSLSFISGMLIAVMIFANAVMMNHIGNIPSVVINHLIGLFIMTALMYITKTQWVSLKGIPVFYLMGGISGILTVTFTNIAFIELGATIALLLSTFGRIAGSTLIDHFGLMGRKRYPIKPIKLIGLTLMLLGTIVLILF